MEYASGGELKEYISSRTRLSELEARKIFLQILSAINHCHSLNVIHRDLKPENILFLNTKHQKIKIVDFGIAGLMQNDKPEKSRAGSLKFMAPEVLSRENIEARPSIDIWSMGCVLFDMICGELPFNGRTSGEIINKIKKGEFQFPQDSEVSYYCRKLIRSMLNVNYRKRITIKELSCHPWIIHSNSKSPLNEKKLDIETDVFKRKTSMNVCNQKKLIINNKMNIMDLADKKFGIKLNQSIKQTLYLPKIRTKVNSPNSYRRNEFSEKQENDKHNFDHAKNSAIDTLTKNYQRHFKRELQWIHSRTPIHNCAIKEARKEIQKRSGFITRNETLTKSPKQKNIVIHNKWSRIHN